VSIRRLFLADIGFADSEIVDILTSPKCSRYSDASTHLFYTSSNYVSTMKERLALLRPETSSLGLIDAADIWGVLTNW
jgi:hypothetical protein